jgi:hypothetical protein
LIRRFFERRSGKKGEEFWENAEGQGSLSEAYFEAVGSWATGFWG